MNILDVLQEVISEKGLNQAALIDIAVEGVLAAYKRKYPELPLRVHVNDQKELVVEIEKNVVSKATDQELEVSLQKAKNIQKNIEVGQTLWVPFEGKIGRVEILKARQVIAQRIREIESQQIYDAFKPKEGEIVVGVIQKYERNGLVVSIGESFAYLPKNNIIPGERLAVGFTIRALLKEVLPEPIDDYQLILDRASTAFVERLFELEIPEVFEHIVEVKDIARAPGYRTKIIVSSKDRNIDPVGTCVGVAGSRIKPILNELHGERIDVIGWSESLEIRVKNALKPAVIDRIELSPDGLLARVWLPEDQRSIAIGKGGRNVALVSRLTGVNVQLMNNESDESQAISHGKASEDDFFDQDN